MRKILFTMAVVATLASCKKNDLEESLKADQQNLSPDIELSVTGETEEVKPLYPQPATYNYLGYGYDVTDRFDSESSIRANVVDVDSYNASPFGTIDINRTTEFSWKTLLGKDAADLSARLSATLTQTNNMQLFGNTLQTSFPGATYTNSNYVYGYYSYYMRRKSYRFYYDQRVNDFISDHFKKDIVSLSAQQLVSKYGTHVLKWINVGAKLDVLYQAKASEGDREKIAMEGQRYALKKTFALMTGYLDEVNLKNLNANSAAKIYYSSTGGDTGKLKPEIMNNRKVINITNWVSSSNDDNARFMGVLREGIEPIYSFINDPAKKAEVKGYIEKYLADKTVKITN